MKAFFICCFNLFLAVNCFAGESVRINGTGAGIALVEILSKQFEKENPHISVEIKGSLGSSASIKAVIADALDIAISGRQLNENETNKGLFSEEYGITPLVVISHKETPVDNLSITQLADLYSGKTDTWPNGFFVRPILRPKEDVDSILLAGLSTYMAVALDNAHNKLGMISTITDRSTYVAAQNTKGSIAVVALTVIKDLKSIKTIKIDNISYSQENVKDKTYPLVKHLYIVKKNTVSVPSQKFLDFIKSKKGRELASDNGLIVTLLDKAKKL